MVRLYKGNPAYALFRDNNNVTKDKKRGRERGGEEGEGKREKEQNRDVKEKERTNEVHKVLDVKRRSGGRNKRVPSLKTIKYREISPQRTRACLSSGGVYVKRAIPLAGAFVCDRLSGADALRHAREILTEMSAERDP